MSEEIFLVEWYIKYIVDHRWCFGSYRYQGDSFPGDIYQYLPVFKGISKKTDINIYPQNMYPDPTYNLIDGPRCTYFSLICTCIIAYIYSEIVHISHPKLHVIFKDTLIIHQCFQTVWFQKKKCVLQSETKKR